jgi:hypothetical protein
MKAKGAQKEKEKEKKMNEQDSKELTDDEKIRRFGKHMERHMGFPRYELHVFELVYCHKLDKFVEHEACNGCRANNGNYRSMWGQQMCSKADHEPPHMLTSEGWTLDELVKILEEERARVLKLKEEEMKDREEFGPIHIETEEEIREREEIARSLSRVSVEDMFRPFTI